MLDMDLRLRTAKLRRFIVQNYSMIEKLLKLKQADFSASYDDLSVCPTITKWRNQILVMKAENIPFTLKELDVTAKDIKELGVLDNKIGEVLKWLHSQTIINPKINKKHILLRMASKYVG